MARRNGETIEVEGQRGTIIDRTTRQLRVRWATGETTWIDLDVVADPECREGLPATSQVQDPVAEMHAAMSSALAAASVLTVAHETGTLETRHLDALAAAVNRYHAAVTALSLA